MLDIFSASALTTLFQVIMIDLVLAGDNAIVIGLAAAGLPKEQRTKVIFVGIAAATVLRIVLALLTTQLLAVVGLLLAGGLLLLWVCWKMWREMRDIAAEEAAASQADARGHAHKPIAPKSLGQAIWTIIVADFSMSLDNVLAVGGAAREHPWVLIFGLALSIALMGLAASWIAQLLQRHVWIGYVGLAIVLYVALEMIWRGWGELQPAVVSFAAVNEINSASLALLAILSAALVTGAALSLKRRERLRD